MEVMTIGSLLTGVGSGVAGLSTAGTLFGVSASTLSAVSGGLGIAGKLFSGHQQQVNYGAQMELTNMATASKNQEIMLQMEREKTQKAVEEEDRQKR